MQFKYLVKGKVENNFIIRGFLCKVNENIELSIYENELSFIQDHCKIDTIKDLTINNTETLDKMLENKNNGGAKNELSNKKNRTYKSKNKT